MTNNTTQPKNYRPEIDGLRAVAVLGVLVSHAEFGFLPGGFLGVDIFFVISGFLITQIIVRETATSKFGLLSFYARRIRRLVPALYFVVLATLAASWFISLPDEFVDISKSTISVLLFSSNIFFWTAEADYFATSALYNPLLHMWSLSVEEQFYFLFSIGVLLFGNLLKNKAIICLVVVLLISLAAAEWGARNYPTASYYLIVTRSWELTLGCLGAIYFERSVRVNSWITRALAFSGVAAILVSFLMIGEHNRIPGLITLVPCIGVLLVLLYGQNSQAISVILGNRPMVFVGLISYSTYLWHQPVFVYARILNIESLSPYHYILLIALVLLLAMFTWACIEQPFRKNKPSVMSTSNSGLYMQFAASSLIIITICVLFIKTGGGEGRLSADTNNIIDALKVEREDRKKNTLYDTCHFRPDRTTIGLDGFKKQWDCLGSGEMVDVVVIGDSHAADIAHSLRESGVNVGQLTGAGCSLEPLFMAPYCKTIFNHLKENYLDNGRLKGVILANRFNEYEMSNLAVSNTNEYWNPEVKKIIFSSKPEYPRFQNQLIRNRLNNAEHYYVDFARADRSYEVYSSYKGENQKVINTKQLFCSIANTEQCNPVFRNEILVSDDSHFSSAGAIFFGNAISDLVLNYFED